MSNRFTRRNVLGMGLATGLVGCRSVEKGHSVEKNVSRSARPKHIIFMVADGMSTGVPSLGEPFSQIARNKGTYWYELSQDPSVVKGWQEMSALNSLVTDSAAASSSWGSGSRIFNGAINMLPDGTRLTPISQLVKDADMNMGLVTTATVAHATPAGFASVAKTRNDMDGIAAQYLDHVDVIMGGGTKNFYAKYRKDKRDLYGEFAKAGYETFDNRGDLLKSPHKQLKTLGLFSKAYIPYVLDQKTDAELDQNTPSLAEMTQVALDRLAQSSKGFLLQVEGGRIDHAAHGNDAAAIMWEYLDYDDAVGVVMEFARTHPDTLVVMTSDHGNSNPGLVGMGAKYSNSNEALECLASVNYTSTGIKDHLTETGTKGKPTPAQVQDVFKELLGLDIKTVDAQAVSEVMAKKKFPDGNSQHRGLVGCMGQVMGNYCGIQWTGTTHTADYTLLYAWGPGSERFHALLRNTDVFTQLTQLMGKDFQNPQMSLVDAQKYLATWTPPDSVYRHLATGEVCV